MADKTERSALGARLKEAREYAGFSQEEVARYLKVPRSAISLIESGRRKIDILELRKLAELFDTSLEDLVESGPREYGDSQSIKMVARATAELDPTDRDEVLRFARFLRARKEAQTDE